METCFYGFHAIEEILKNLHSQNTKALLKYSKENSKVRRLIELAKRVNVGTERTSDGELERISDTTKHRGVVLVVREFIDRKNLSFKTMLQLLERKKDSVILVLDGITDPQNFGAILRSADQFGVDLVVIPSRRSVKDTPTVSRVSAGADVYVNISVVQNIPSAIEELKENNFWVYGADMNGEELFRADLKGRCAIVMGREGEGLHRLVRERCDKILAIPRMGHIDSLNVSVAAGIFLYEVRRQQLTVNNSFSE